MSYSSALMLTQRHVTQWGPRVALTVAVLVIIGLALWGMRRGWTNRAKQQSAIPAPPSVPTQPAGLLAGPCAGSYLASTSAAQWLDRIVVHSLGVPSKAMLSVRADGVLVDREGEPALFIPKAAIEEVRLDRGIAGEVYEAGSVLIITWSLGDYRLDTGVRSTSTADHSAIALAAKSLLDSNSGTAAIAPTEGAS